VRRYRGGINLLATPTASPATMDSVDHQHRGLPLARMLPTSAMIVKQLLLCLAVISSYAPTTSAQLQVDVICVNILLTDRMYIMFRSDSPIGRSNWGTQLTLGICGGNGLGFVLLKAETATALSYFGTTVGLTNPICVPGCGGCLLASSIADCAANVQALIDFTPAPPPAPTSAPSPAVTEAPISASPTDAASATSGPTSAPVAPPTYSIRMVPGSTTCFGTVGYYPSDSTPTFQPLGPGFNGGTDVVLPRYGFVFAFTANADTPPVISFCGSGVNMWVHAQYVTSSTAAQSGRIFSCDDCEVCGSVEPNANFTVYSVNGFLGGGFVEPLVSTLMRVRSVAVCVCVGGCRGVCVGGCVGGWRHIDDLRLRLAWHQLSLLLLLPFFVFIRV